MLIFLQENYYENYTNYNAFFEESIPNLPVDIFTEKESPFDIRVSKIDFESLLFKKINFSAGFKYIKSDLQIKDEEKLIESILKANDKGKIKIKIWIFDFRIC